MKDQKEYIPSITINSDKEIASINNFIIIPHNIDVISNSLPVVGRVGSIIVDYPDVKDVKIEEEVEDDYDEDEQLYAAAMHLSLNKKYSTIEIPIIENYDLNLSVTVPHFSNVIVNNLVAQQIVKAFSCKVKGQWITLAPCNLNNYQSINKLVLGDYSQSEALSMVPDLKPPHFLTGIVASVISQLKFTTNSRILGLVLNADGQPGFEKIDADSIVDAAYILSETVFALDKENIIKKISSLVRKFNSVSNSGMFI